RSGLMPTRWSTYRTTPYHPQKNFGHLSTRIPPGSALHGNGKFGARRERRLVLGSWSSHFCSQIIPTDNCRQRAKKIPISSLFCSILGLDLFSMALKSDRLH